MYACLICVENREEIIEHNSLIKALLDYTLAFLTTYNNVQ